MGLKAITLLDQSLCPVLYLFVCGDHKLLALGGGLEVSWAEALGGVVADGNVPEAIGQLPAAFGEARLGQLQARVCFQDTSSRQLRQKVQPLAGPVNPIVLRRPKPLLRMGMVADFGTIILQGIDHLPDLQVAKDHVHFRGILPIGQSLLPPFSLPKGPKKQEQVAFAHPALCQVALGGAGLSQQWPPSGSPGKCLVIQVGIQMAAAFPAKGCGGTKSLDDRPIGLTTMLQFIIGQGIPRLRDGQTQQGPIRQNRTGLPSILGIETFST